MRLVGLFCKGVGCVWSMFVLEIRTSLMGHAFWSGHAFGRDVFGREMCLVGTCVWSGHAFWSGNVFGRDMLLVDPNPECHCVKTILARMFTLLASAFTMLPFMVTQTVYMPTLRVTGVFHRSGQTTDKFWSGQGASTRQRGFSLPSQNCFTFLDGAR